MPDDMLYALLVRSTNFTEGKQQGRKAAADDIVGNALHVARR